MSQFDGRKYCEHDFNVLYAPCCAKCGKTETSLISSRSNNIGTFGIVVVTASRHFRDWSRDKGDEHELAPAVFYVSFMRYVSRRLWIRQECWKVSDDVYL